MASIIHLKLLDCDISEWKDKAVPYHFRPASQFEFSWRYLIAKNNIIGRVKAEV